MVDLRLTVLDPAGLHARPAAQFVRTASRFASRITIRVGDRSADVKSLTALLGLTVRQEGQITLIADGPDADAAVAALVAELGPSVEPANAASETH